VKAIEGIAVDTHVEVRNHDVDRVDKNVVSKDENGRAWEILGRHAPEWREAWVPVKLLVLRWTDGKESEFSWELASSSES
jgi:hypothetical protein